MLINKQTKGSVSVPGSNLTFTAHCLHKKCSVTSSPLPCKQAVTEHCAVFPGMLPQARLTWWMNCTIFGGMVGQCPGPPELCTETVASTLPGLQWQRPWQSDPARNRQNYSWKSKENSWDILERMVCEEKGKTHLQHPGSQAITKQFIQTSCNQNPLPWISELWSSFIMKFNNKVPIRAKGMTCWFNVKSWSLADFMPTSAKTIAVNFLIGEV